MANSKIEEAANEYAKNEVPITHHNKIEYTSELKAFKSGALSDAAKEYWFEFNKYEGYENWNDERDCLKGEIQAYRKIISELDKELAQLKHQEQKPIDKLEFRYYKELFNDLLTILNERRNKYDLQGAHEWKIEGYDLAVKVVKSTLLDAPGTTVELEQQFKAQEQKPVEVWLNSRIEIGEKEVKALTVKGTYELIGFYNAQIQAYKNCLYKIQQQEKPVIDLQPLEQGYSNNRIYIEADKKDANGAVAIDTHTAFLKEVEQKERPVWVNEVVEALSNLIKIKDYKDEYGKDKFYSVAQLKAWENARNAIKSMNESTMQPQPTDEEISISAWQKWEEDRKTNPSVVNPNAFTYGYKIGFKAAFKTKP